MKHDVLQKFMFDRAPIRGEIVSLQSPWQHIVSLHDFPAPVRTILGEMLAAATLLTSTLKFDGALVMQLQGDGPVKLLVVECLADLGVRATAKVDPDARIDDEAGLQELVNVHGRARMAITLDPREKLPGQQPYQGIVPVEGDSIANILEVYMARSEQLPTRLWLASDARGAAGLLVQRMPANGGSTPIAAASDDETWERVLTLSETIRRDELLSLPPQEVLHRLYWQEDDVRVFTPRAARFSCSCTRAKVGNMLLMLGRAEVDSVLEEFGTVHVNCEYCNAAYTFDRVDVAQLFSSGTGETGTTTGDARRH